MIDPVHDTPPIKRSQIDVTGRMGDILTRDIIAAYLAGSDIIEIKADRILAEQKQDLLNPDESSIKKSVRRMFLISNSMYGDAIKAVKTLDRDLALDVDQRDDDVDRLFLLIAKQFRAVLRGARLPDAMETSIDEYHDLRMAAGPIESIADHARKIARATYSFDDAIPDDIMEMIEKTSNISMKILADSMDSLYNSDVDVANQVIEGVAKISPLINKLNEATLKLSSPGSVVALGAVVDSIDRIADYAANIAEIAINSAMTKSGI